MIETTRRLYCHECRAWIIAEAEHDPAQESDEWLCTVCASDILCDECGQPWRLNHDGPNAHPETAYR